MAVKRIVQINCDQTSGHPDAICDKCQLPIGTVKSRTWYALRSLRLVLEEMGVVP